MFRRRGAKPDGGASDSISNISPAGELEEFTEADLEDVLRRSSDLIRDHLERYRETIEQSVGSFEVDDVAGRVRVVVDDQPMYLASVTPAGRLLLYDVSGRYDERL